MTNPVKGELWHSKDDRHTHAEVLRVGWLFVDYRMHGRGFTCLKGAFKKLFERHPLMGIDRGSASGDRSAFTHTEIHHTIPNINISAGFLTDTATFTGDLAKGMNKLANAMDGLRRYHNSHCDECSTRGSCSDCEDNDAIIVVSNDPNYVPAGIDVTKTRIIRRTQREHEEWLKAYHEKYHEGMSGTCGVSGVCGVSGSAGTYGTNGVSGATYEYKRLREIYEN